MQNEKTILLVEDNPDDEALTLRAFKKCKVANHIVVTRDGKEALDYLLGSGDSEARGTPQEIPSLVLLDLKLPKIDGLEVLRRLRECPRTKRLPIVVLTTSNEEQDIVTSYDLGANSYITKPVNFESFIEAVGQLGLYWLLINEPPPVD